MVKPIQIWNKKDFEKLSKLELVDVAYRHWVELNIVIRNLMEEKK